jgi:hypothetical protein
LHEGTFSRGIREESAETAGAQYDMEMINESLKDIIINIMTPFWSGIVVMLKSRLKYIITLVIAKAIGSSINHLLTILGPPCPFCYLFHSRRLISS